MGNEGFDEVACLLDRFLRIFLVIVAVGIMTVTLLMIVTMDNLIESQGGRLYVAIAGVLLLGWVDSQYTRLAKRSRPFSLEGPGETAYWRYVARSGMLLLLSGVVLVGLALFLP